MRDSSRTQACIYKAEGEDLSPPLLLQLIPAPAYSPTNTLRSTIGDEVLNCQVRHGAGCVHQYWSAQRALPSYTPNLSIRSSAGRLIYLCNEVSHLKAGFPLRCLQRLSDPNMATQRVLLAEQLVH